MVYLLLMIFIHFSFLINCLTMQEIKLRNEKKKTKEQKLYLIYFYSLLNDMDIKGIYKILEKK